MISYRDKRAPDAVQRSFDAPPRPAPKAMDPDADLPPGRPLASFPWSIRVVLWIVYVVQNVTLAGLVKVVSRTSRRWTVRVLLLYPKAYGLIRAITGGRVDPDEYAQRMIECGNCDSLVTLTRSKVGAMLNRVGFKVPKDRRFCGSCGCPKWALSELRRKNRWKRHYCPLERHARTDYPPFVTVSPSGCGQRAFKVPGGRSNDGGRN